MNYALDALWWRLTDNDVRALASILTAPALWRSGCELSVRTLLGEAGFRYLLSLDGKSEPLRRHLAAEVPFGNRLGLYAESLLAFWLSAAPHSELLARNLSVPDESGRMLGALDFAARLNGRIYHIELTCKYYAHAAADPAGMTGLNLRDRLADKAEKLQTQLALPHTVAGKRALAQVGLDAADIQSVSLVRGTGFAAEGRTFGQEPLNPLAWQGRLLASDEPLPFAADSRFYVLPRMELLAPARVDEAQCCGAEEIAAQQGILFALMEKRPDGMMHEVLRLMKPAMPV